MLGTTMVAACSGRCVGREAFARRTFGVLLTAFGVRFTTFVLLATLDALGALSTLTAAATATAPATTRSIGAIALARCTLTHRVGFEARHLGICGRRVHACSVGRGARRTILLRPSFAAALATSFTACFATTFTNTTFTSAAFATLAALLRLLGTRRSVRTRLAAVARRSRLAGRPCLARLAIAAFGPRAARLAVPTSAAMIVAVAALAVARALAVTGRTLFESGLWRRGARGSGGGRGLGGSAEPAEQLVEESAAFRLDGHGTRGAGRLRHASRLGIVLRQRHRRRLIGRDALHQRLRPRRHGLRIARRDGGGLLGRRGHHLVARRLRIELRRVVAQALDVVVGRFQVRVGNQEHVHLEARLDLEDLGALLVEEIGRDADRNLRVDGRGSLLHRLFLEDAQHVQRGGSGIANVSRAVTARAGGVRGLFQRRLQALA